MRTVPLCEACHGKVHRITFEGHGVLVRAGISRAKANGQRLGRPPLAEERPKVYREILSLRQVGLG